MIRPAPVAVLIDYPSSDGKPMAENDAQRDAILYGVDQRPDPPLQGPPGRVRLRRTGHELRSHDEEAEGRLAGEARVAELEALLRRRPG